MAKSRKRTSAKSAGKARKMPKYPFMSSRAAEETAQSSYSAFESGRNSAENVMRIGTEAVRELMSSSAGEAQKAQEKVLAFSRESAENMSRSADALSRAMNEAVSLSRENFEACMECSNIAAEMSKSMSAEFFNYANNAFSQNVEYAKEFLSCRTINDMFDLQSEIVKRQMDGFFNESARLSEIFFRYASEAAEPLNERMVEATERFTKSMAA